MAQKEKPGANKKDKKSRRGKKRQERSKRQDSKLCLSDLLRGAYVTMLTGKGT